MIYNAEWEYENNDKLYLISEEDYIKHINEKVYLYSLVKQLHSIFGDDVTFHITVD